MNFKKLENNLLDMIQEQQVKIGYMSGVTRFYYPLQSLNRLLGTELTEEEMQHAMEEFSDYACDRLGKVKASSKNERFCITLPPQASDYVHENRKPSEFLVRFINTVARHGCTLDEVMNIQREGREKRQAAEAELRNMEQELKAKLLQIQG